MKTTILGLQVYTVEAGNDFQFKCQRIGMPELSGFAQINDDEREAVPRAISSEQTHPFNFEFVDNDGAILVVQAEKLILNKCGQFNTDDWLGSFISHA